MATIPDVSHELRYNIKPGDRRSFSMNPIPSEQELNTMFEAISEHRPELGQLEFTLIGDQLFIVSKP